MVMEKNNIKLNSKEKKSYLIFNKVYSTEGKNSFNLNSCNWSNFWVAGQSRVAAGLLSAVRCRPISLASWPQC